MKRSGETGRSIVKFLKSKESGRIELNAKGSGIGSFVGNERNTMTINSLPPDEGEIVTENKASTTISHATPMKGFTPEEIGGVLTVNIELLKVLKAPFIDGLVEEAVHAGNYSQAALDQGSNLDMDLARGNNEFSAKAVVGQVEKELGRPITDFSKDKSARSYGVSAFANKNTSGFVPAAIAWRSQQDIRSSYSTAPINNKVPTYFKLLVER